MHEQGGMHFLPFRKFVTYLYRAPVQGVQDQHQSPLLLTTATPSVQGRTVDLIGCLRKFWHS